jgi:hypothetical protein
MNAMRSVVFLALLVVFGEPASGQEAEPVLRAEMCSLAQEPEKWAGRFVSVRARLVRLRSREWGLHDTCWPPVLLLLPDGLKPPPDFVMAPDSDTRALRRAKLERVSLVGTFEGRIDWSGDDKRRTFGKAELPVRMVLRRLSDCTIIDLPYK